jgi:hypothetical protein
VPVARRQLLTLAGASLLLSACGGGGSTDDGSDGILDFRADRAVAMVGDRVALTAVYRGHAARIEPGIGPVTSGQPVLSPALDRDVRFELVVETAAGVRRQVLDVPVRHRDRYVPSATSLAASLFALAPLPDGRVLVIGGSRGLGVVSDAVDVYDPDTHRLRRLTRLASGRAEHRATALADGRVLVTGGLASLGGSERSELIEPGPAGDPGSARVVASGAMSVPRVYHAALALSDGRVLVTGGVAAGEGPARPASDSAEIWDPTSGRFRRLGARMAISRSSHTMTLLPDGRVLVAGGYTERASYVPFEVFDPATETFTPLPFPGTLRANHVAHLDAQGRVLVLGGETVGPAGEIVRRADVVRVDAAAARVETMPALQAPRSLAASVALPSGEVLLFGGELPASRPTASAERYDPATGGRPIASMDSARAWHGATRLPSGRVLVLGGEGPGGAYASAVLVYE